MATWTVSFGLVVDDAGADLEPIASQCSSRVIPAMALTIPVSISRSSPRLVRFRLTLTRAGMINQLWTILKKRGVIRHHLTSSDDWRALDAKFNALCSLPMPGAKMRRLDILGVPWDEMPAALIYFTGNDVSIGVASHPPRLSLTRSPPSTSTGP